MEAFLSFLSYNHLFYYYAVDNKSKGIDDNIKMKACQRLKLQTIMHVLQIESLS